MEIRIPVLPPKAGYVEVVDENGNHIYKPTVETTERLKKEQEVTESIENTQNTINILLDAPENNESSAAIELRRAVQLFANSLEDEELIMEIATVYPSYMVGIAYEIGDIFRYGTNSVDDPQLYQVLQAHTSAEEWTPDNSPSLYKKIGISDDGTPIWVQPLGAMDAYNTGDVVMYNGQKYESLIDGNVWSPDAYPAGWQLVQ